MKAICAPAIEKSSGTVVVRMLAATFATLVMLCLYSTTAFGQCSLLGATTWSDGNGDWNNGLNWMGGVPNSSTNACITDGTSAVTLATTGSVDSLQLGSGNS